MTNLAPIALFCYKRLDVLTKTVKALKKNTESKNSLLFIFSDGYKDEKDKADVAKVRKYIKTINGFKDIQIIESPYNKGLADSIIDGVTKIVNEYGKIIVVEDDILTSPYFLKYLNDALNIYEHEDKVGSITSYGFDIKKMPQTYFSRRFSCWGWATWKRSWDLFERDGQILLEQLENTNKFYEFDFEGTQNFVTMLKDQIKGKNNSWAIRMYASQFLNNKLQLHPGISYSRNIGFGKLATHCTTVDKRYNVPINRKPIKLSKIKIEERKDVIEKSKKYFIQMSLPIVEKPSFCKHIIYTYKKQEEKYKRKVKLLYLIFK